MKTIKQIFSAIFALALCVTAQAQSWSDAFGIGNPGGDPFFSGSGLVYGTQNGTRSNYLYFITSASGAAPQVTSASFWTDMARPILEVLVATNSFQVTVSTNNTPPLTNIWINSTNIQINDVMVYRSAALDSYQLFIVTNGPTTTNIQIATALTNAAAAGDVVYKMARVQAINPAVWYQSDNGTNGLSFTKTNYYVLPSGKVINGRSGVPMVIGTFATNHAAVWLQVDGSYVPARVGIR